MAEKLGRTVGELLHGSAAHRPLSAIEMTQWMAVWELRAYEQEQAMKRK